MGVSVAVDWVAGRVITRCDDALHLGFRRPSKKGRTSRKARGFRIRESVDGLEPIPIFRGIPPEELSELPAWVASRGPPELLAAKLREDDGYGRERDLDGWTCLHHAAAAGATRHVEILICNRRDHDDTGDLINLKEKLNGWTAVHLAVIAKHADVLGILLAQGGSIDIPDDQGFTPLDMAPERLQKYSKRAAHVCRCLFFNEVLPPSRKDD